ncbi:MAG: Fe-S cluster assembly protein HesB [Methanomicrobiales archaeon]|nr:Fe-S cluster assembly protein HesB [Methanomicrobiales archaeon]
MIGAVLTQQTRWANVAMALDRLKERDMCSIKALYEAPDALIEEVIRPAGFYQVKTRRIKALAQLIINNFGNVETMQENSIVRLREALLGVKGIGAETADSILCFGLGKPSFVIDRYTEQICSCGGILRKGNSLKGLVEEVLPLQVALYQEVHGRFVEYAKEYCGRKRCKECEIGTLNE